MTKPKFELPSNMSQEQYNDMLHEYKKLLKSNKLIVTFIEPDSLHPGSDSTTIAEVANFLEARYHLVETFCETIKADVARIFAAEILRCSTLDKALKMVEEFVKNEWRDYILSAKHNKQSKAASQRGSEPFVDTGAYYKNMMCRLEV